MHLAAADVRRLILSLTQEIRASLRRLLQIRAGPLFVLLFARGLVAAEPSLDAFYPAGGALNSTNTITAIGKFDPWPPKVWVSEPGLTFVAGTNKGKFAVAISADAVPGPRLVRLYNEEGASEPRTFVVGAGHEITEIEPNNHFAKSQPINPLPATINGRLDKSGDVDSFAIELRGSEWLDARVDCYTLMSKVDAVLRLMTTTGEQLAWNHDFATLDPRLVFRAEENQTVVLQIFGFAFPPDSDIRLTGGDAAVYRLRVTASNNPPAICDVPTERGSNDATGKLPKVELPALIHASIAKADNEDRFQFRAKKNEWIDVRVEAASFGSPLDAWLKIEDAAGNQLARNDDAEGSRDPRLEWKVPTNGTFMVAIGSVTHRGGPDFCYRLSIQKAEPDFRGTLSSSSFTLTPGATNELKFDLKRFRGFTNELTFGLRGLPEGVSILTTNLPGKDGTASIKLSSATNATAFQGPAQLLLTDAQTRSERVVPVELTTRGETGFNRLLVETADEFWFTIREKAASSSKAPAKK